MFALSSLFLTGTLVSVVAAVVIELFVFVTFLQGLAAICSYLGVLGGFCVTVLSFCRLILVLKGVFSC